MNTPDPNSPAFLASIAGIGFVLGIFQVLATGEKVTIVRAVCRAGVTAGFSLAAMSLFIIFPVMPVAPAVGVAALLASLGTTGLERLVDRLLGPKKD